MAKKTFTETVTPFYKAVEAEVTQEAQETQDTSEEYNARNTQGKAGMKAPRINMAFSPANHEFIVIMAHVHKISVTQYVNRLIEEERKRSADKYEQAKAFMESL